MPPRPDIPIDRSVSYTAPLMLPQFVYSVAGENRPALGTSLKELEIYESVSGEHRASVLLNNWSPQGAGSGFLYFDRSVIDFGRALRISTSDALLFSGRIIAWDAGFPSGSPPTLRVRAENALFDLRRVKRTRTFTNVSDADIFRRLVQDHGLEDGIDFAGPVHKVVAQVNLDDLTFLQIRCREIGAEFWMEDRRLRVATRETRNAGSLNLTYGNTLISFSATADLTGQITQASVAGWDRMGKSEVVGTTDATGAGRSLLQAGWGDSREIQSSPPAGATEEASQRAKAIAQARARGFVTGHGLATGTASLRAGTKVNFSGLGPLLNGTHTVTEVWHRFDPTAGWRVEFSTERPQLDGP